TSLLSTCRRPRRWPLFPYTTLFRSGRGKGHRGRTRGDLQRRGRGLFLAQGATPPNQWDRDPQQGEKREDRPSLPALAKHRFPSRSEERRVGKEGTVRGWRCQ